MASLKYRQLINFAIYEGRRRFLANLACKEQCFTSDQDVEDNFSLMRESIEREKGRISDEEFKSYVETKFRELSTHRMTEFRLPVITSRGIFF